MLSPDQVTQMRAAAGIPAQGLGSSAAPSANDRIAKLQQASGYQAPAAKINPLSISEKGVQKADAFLNGPISKGIQSIFPGKQVGEAIGTLGGLGATAIGEKLGLTPKGATENFDTSAPSPLQVGGDIAKGAGLIGGLGAAPSTVLGAVGTGAAAGALQGGGQSAIQTSGKAIPTGEDLTKTAEGTALGGAIGGAVSGAVSGIGKLIGSLGDKIMNSVVRPSKADIEDGFTVNTIKKYNLGGSLSTMYNKTEDQLKTISQQLNDKLEGAHTSVNLNDVVAETQKALGGNKLRSFGSNTSLESAVNQLKNEIASLDKTDITVPEAQLVKQSAGKFGAWQYGIPDPESTARQDVYSTFYNKLKTAIEKSSPEGVKDLNKQLAELIPVQNAIIRRLPVAARNNALSLPDMIGLVGSAVNPKALVGLGISLAQKSGTVGNLLSRTAGPGITGAAPALGTLAGGVAGSLTGTTESPDQSELGQSNTSSHDTTNHDASQAAIKQGTDLAGKFDPTGVLGVERVGGKLLADDAAALTKYIDAVRLGKSPSESVWKGGESILEKLGANMNWSLGKLANYAEDVLSGKVDPSKLYKTGREFSNVASKAQEVTDHIVKNNMIPALKRDGDTEIIKALEKTDFSKVKDYPTFEKAIKTAVGKLEDKGNPDIENWLKSGKMMFDFVMK